MNEQNQKLPDSSAKLAGNLSISGIIVNTGTSPEDSSIRTSEVLKTLKKAVKEKVFAPLAEENKV